MLNEEVRKTFQHHTDGALWSGPSHKHIHAHFILHWVETVCKKKKKKVDESKRFSPVILRPALLLERTRGGFAKAGSLSGKQMNTDVVFFFFFSFYRLFMSCKFLLQKSGSGFNGTGEETAAFCSNALFPKTNDTQSHKALAAACCRGRMPTV